MARNTKNFNKRLQSLLTVSGVSREDLARCLGVSMLVVNRWLNGASAPDVYQFREIARFFGLPYEWFLDSGDNGPSAEEMADLLGLSEDTVEELLYLADTEGDRLLGVVDGAVYAVISIVNAVYDNLPRVVDNSVEDVK